MQYGSRYVAERLMNTAQNGSTSHLALDVHWMPVATGPVRAPHNPHNHVQFIGRALQAQVRNGEVETIAHLDSLRPPQRPSLCGATAQHLAMRGIFSL